MKSKAEQKAARNKHKKSFQEQLNTLDPEQFVSASAPCHHSDHDVVSFTTSSGRSFQVEIIGRRSIPSEHDHLPERRFTELPVKRRPTEEAILQGELLRQEQEQLRATRFGRVGMKPEVEPSQLERRIAHSVTAALSSLQFATPKLGGM